MRLCQSKAERHEKSEILLVMRCQRCSQTNRCRGNKTIRPTAPLTPRLIEQCRCHLSLRSTKRDNSAFDKVIYFQYLLLLDGAVQKFSPCDRTGGKAFSLLQPISQFDFDRGMLICSSDKKIRIEMNHFRFRPQARRSRRISALYFAAASSEIPFFWSQSSASRGVSTFSSAGKSRGNPSIARRMTSDLGTPQAVANSCTRSTVSGFKE
jgi:hypothetical protein